MRFPFPYTDIHDFIFYKSLGYFDRSRRQPFFREVEKLAPEIRDLLKQVKASDLNVRPDLVW